LASMITRTRNRNGKKDRFEARGRMGQILGRDSYRKEGQNKEQNLRKKILNHKEDLTDRIPPPGKWKMGRTSSKKGGGVGSQRQKE